MEATLRQAQQPGYACITVTNCPPVTDLRCSIQRGSDGQYLSKEGLWGNTIESLIPENPFQDNDQLTFFLPLHIVSDIDSLDGYALYINDLDRCILEIPEELNVRDAGPTGCVTGVPETEPAPQNTAGFIPSQPVPVPEPQPVPVPEPQPAPEPAQDPVQNPDAALPPQGETGLESDGSQEQQVSDLSLSGQPGTEAPKKKNMLPAIIAIAVVLLLAAGAGLYFSGCFDSTENPTPAEEPADKDNAEGKAEDKADAAKEEPAPATEPPAREEPAAPAEAPAGAPQDTQPAAPEPGPAGSPLSQARTLLQGGAASTALLDTARPMRSAQASEESSDAAFLLIEQAAQNGDNAEAMYLLAQYYDPSATLPRGTIQPDLAQAHDWYKKARDKGYNDADAALAKLKETVEAKAGTGDREAGYLLRNW